MPMPAASCIDVYKRQAGRQYEHVGVVVLPDQFGDLAAPDQSGTDMLVFVERDGHRCV